MLQTSINFRRLDDFRHEITIYSLFLLNAEMHFGGWERAKIVEQLKVEQAR